MKTIFLISNEKQVKNIKYGMTVVLLNESLSNKLKNKKIQFKKINEYIKEVNIEEKTIEFIKNWSNEKIDGKNFKQWFDYEGLSLWWLMEDWVYHSYIYHDSLKEIVEGIEKIKNLIQKEKPTKIVFYNDGSLIYKIVKLLSKKEDIKVIEKKFFLKNSFSSIKKNIKIRLITEYMGLVWFLRKNYWRILKKQYKPERFSKGKRILFFSTDSWQSLVIPDTGDITKGDAYLFPIVYELNKDRQNVVAIDTTFSFPVSSITTLKEKIRNEYVDYKLFENYIDRKTSLKVKKILRKFKKRFNSIKIREEFKDSFIYEDINIWDLIKKQFSAYFNFRMRGHIMELETIKKIIEEEKPDVVAITDETRAFGRSLFYACKKEGIPCIAVQHGVIEKSLRCTHRKDEICDKIGPLCCPIPDKTCVYGENDKKFLVKNFYPENTVAVTGCQRYDSLFHSEKLFDKKEISKEVGIDLKKKVAVLFTNSFYNMEKDAASLRAVLKAFKEMPDIQLIVKPHPAENSRMHYDIIKEEKSSAVFAKDANTFELLYIADITIIYYSTVGLEAMSLDKPLIILNLTGQPDKVNYVKEGAAVGVYKEEDLKKVIKDIIENKEFINELKKKRNKFIYAVAYKKDGMASKRIAEIIKGSC